MGFYFSFQLFRDIFTFDLSKSSFQITCMFSHDTYGKRNQSNTDPSFLFRACEAQIWHILYLILCKLSPNGIWGNQLETVAWHGNIYTYTHMYLHDLLFKKVVWFLCWLVKAKHYERGNQVSLYKSQLPVTKISSNLNRRQRLLDIFEFRLSIFQISLKMELHQKKIIVCLNVFSCVHICLSNAIFKKMVEVIGTELIWNIRAMKKVISIHTNETNEPLLFLQIQSDRVQNEKSLMFCRLTLFCSLRKIYGDTVTVNDGNGRLLLLSHHPLMELSLVMSHYSHYSHTIIYKGWLQCPVVTRYVNHPVFVGTSPFPA